MSGDKLFKKFPDLPSKNWTIVYVSRGPFHDDGFVAYNTVTGDESKEFPTYALAVKWSEEMEWINTPKG